MVKKNVFCNSCFGLEVFEVKTASLGYWVNFGELGEPWQTILQLFDLLRCCQFRVAPLHLLLSLPACICFNFLYLKYTSSSRHPVSSICPLRFVFRENPWNIHAFVGEPPPLNLQGLKPWQTNMNSICWERRKDGFGGRDLGGFPGICVLEFCWFPHVPRGESMLVMVSWWKIEPNPMVFPMFSKKDIFF